MREDKEPDTRKAADLVAENFRHPDEHGLLPQTLAEIRAGLIYGSAKGVSHHGA